MHLIPYCPGKALASGRDKHDLSCTAYKQHCSFNLGEGNPNLAIQWRAFTYVTTDLVTVDVPAPIFVT